MNTDNAVKIYNDVVDKSSWPRGEWDNEPDKIQWKDKTTGYPCLIVRSQLGNLCGYVGVPEGHPLHHGDYDDENFPVLLAHGGITFADTCAKDGNEAENICHIPELGDPDNVWWFGFDCGHYDDFAPGMPMLHLRNPENYKNVAYVKVNITLLAAQLKEFEDGHVR